MAALPAALLGLALIFGAAGCGDGKSASEPPALGTTMRGIARSAASLPRGMVTDGCLVTFDEGDLAGRLPPAQPVRLITRGNPDLKRVALTIDDGWNADMRILDLLKRSKIKFTAFLIGGRGVAESNPEFVKRIQDSGGEVCSHTYTHYVMRGKDKPTVLDEIWRSQEIITRVTHEIYPYIRFSGGAYDENSLNWAAEQGYWVVNWTISDNDTANGVTPDGQVNAVLANLQPGGIILCHFGGHNTYEVLSRVIPEIQKRGYEVTSLTRVLEGTPFVLKPSPTAGE